MQPELPLEEKGTDSVAIVSGGLDSTTLVYDMLDRGYLPHLLSFNYGQRHAKELTYASWTARQLQLPHDIIDLTGITRLISNSALTSGNECICGPAILGEGPLRECPQHGELSVPEGHYAEDNMKLTVVPNRNMIMLSIAVGVAVNEHARCVGIGVHSGDHEIYPDCRPEFINTMEMVIVVANRGFHNFDLGLPKTNGKPKQWNEDLEQSTINHVLLEEVVGAPEQGPLYAPFLFKTKSDIAYRALELNVPLHMTWSCYKGGEQHCGRCGTCVERLEAIHNAITLAHPDYDRDDVEQAVRDTDITSYLDTEYWKTAVRDKS
jgi:7-cyano-7-deazaguanine synthase